MVVLLFDLLREKLYPSIWLDFTDFCLSQKLKNNTSKVETQLKMVAKNN